MQRALLSLLAAGCLLTVAPSEGRAEETLIRWQRFQLSDTFFSEGAATGDFNNDGHGDVVSGPFWYAGPDFRKQHLFAPPKPFDPHGYSDNFFAYAEDFNGDDWTDILIIGFPGKEAFWYENPKGTDRFWTKHLALAVVDNESPTFVDLTGDGRREIVCSQDQRFGYAGPDPADPTAPWTFHPISGKATGGRFTHGMGVGDVNGDGRADLLEKNGWWEQPESLEGDPEWTHHPVQFSGPGGAQMFAYDFDGDGDQDVLTSLAAHGYGLAWYENITVDGKTEFTPRLIMGDAPEENRYGVVFSQLHAVDLADIDGDGLKDIVTGKRYWAHGPRGDAEPNAAPVLYWFRTVRQEQDGKPTVDFVPYRIDDNSGVGVEVKATDINGDGLPDVVVGNKRGTFVHLQQRVDVSKEEWERAQPRRLDQGAKKRQGGLPQASGLEPDEAARAMTVPEGFKVQLAAGEPQVHQPVAFTIDHRGRLWVAEAYTYPARAEEGQGKDRIVILDDEDGDGAFESRKVFIEGLNLVSGLEVGFGGVWVGAPPYLMFIPDRDGDDRPDAPPQAAAANNVQFPGDVPAGAEVLLDGFGWHDTHETLNSFIWGPDGWLYGCHGVFTHSKVGAPGTPDEERTPINAGVWRYHPVDRTFEVFAWGTSNPWGVDFNDYGEAFITACVIPHLYHIVPGARYQRQAGRHFNPHVYDDIKTIADHAHYAGSIRDHAWWGRDEPVAHDATDLAGGGHAHCGAMVYLGDNWPEVYRNSIFMANIHGNRVNNDILRQERSGYVGLHGQDFLFANDRWFRGINLKYGPDGGVFLIDWYDQNACHRHDPEIWDRTNGRIYKVTYGNTPSTRVDLAAMSDEELAELHTRQNDWYVRMSRRLLQERAANDGVDDSAVDALATVLEENSDVTRRLRAQWTLHAIDRLDEETLTALLDEHDAHLRGWAIRLLSERNDRSDDATGKLAGMARSERSPIVRRELASAMRQLPHDVRWTIGEGLVSHGDDADDHNIPLLIWYGVEPLVVEDPARAFAMAGSSRIPLVARFIYRRAASDDQTLPELLTALGKTNDVPRQELILAEIVDVVKNRGRLTMPKTWPDVFARLSGSESEKVRQDVQFITVKFGDRSIFPALRDIVANGNADAASRQQALDALLAGKDPELPPLLHELLDEKTLRGPALRGLAAYEHSETPEKILSRYSKLSDSEKDDALATLASRAGYAHALLDAIAEGSVPRTDLSAATATQMQRFGDKELLAKINRHWGALRTTSAEKKQLIAEFKERLTPEVLADADLRHGRAVFEKTCAKCHRLFGSGEKIGPDITGSNRANLDYLLENLLDPSAVVGRDYQVTVVQTSDGRVVSGLMLEENDSAIVLQTVNERVVVPKDDIEDRVQQATSLMPEGQLQQLPPEDARDLIAYLGSPSQVPLPGQGPFFDPESGKVLGAIEGESMKVVGKTGGNARSQKMHNFTADRWSGSDHLWWTGGKPGDRLTLEFTVEEAGRYELFTVLTKAHDYGAFQLSIDGQPAGPPIDLYNGPAVVTTGVVSLGEHELEAGKRQLGVEVVGAHPKATKSYMFGIDYLYLEPVAPAQAEK
ncbi:FG-GAP repeat protein [Maioricimonas rarisocia]|uniref:FG-GAP repeat protein n=1 Tax=Maioricimonas rarisocia TaxID=2528026 RepID=A0A517ZEU8_9PLAN|nr:PVC-type heme-binding CxxCH protein [Maioricimonas rarisocia]QDU41015.1 FG-GAP repeat protein [Maioricimonas rarisocia]